MYLNWGHAVFTVINHIYVEIYSCLPTRSHGFLMRCVFMNFTLMLQDVSLDFKFSYISFVCMSFSVSHHHSQIIAKHFECLQNSQNFLYPHQDFKITWMRQNAILAVGSCWKGKRRGRGIVKWKERYKYELRKWFAKDVLEAGRSGAKWREVERKEREGRKREKGIAAFQV